MPAIDAFCLTCPGYLVFMSNRKRPPTYDLVARGFVLEVY
jgi:hypothetical protein